MESVTLLVQYIKTDESADENQQVEIPFTVPIRSPAGGISSGANDCQSAQLPQRDGLHDFDFLIGDWKAHVKRLPDRLNNSNVWVEYDGISNHGRSSTATRTLKSLR